MEIFSNIINFFKDNWLEILALIGAIDIALGIIVKWTKWTWDDSVYAILHNLVSKFWKK